MRKKIFIIIIILVLCIAGFISLYKATREYIIGPDTGVYFKMSETTLKIKKGMPAEKQDNGDVTPFYSILYNDYFEDYSITSHYEFAPVFLGSQLRYVSYDYTTNNQAKADEIYGELKKEIESSYCNKSGYTCEDIDNMMSVSYDINNPEGVTVYMLKNGKSITVVYEYIY